jgi:predicted naringenin-chalcone synthase
MPEYDFFRTVREDLGQLSRELTQPGVREAIDSLATRLGASREEMLAVLWRSSKRHGETLSAFVLELNEQSQRETARASGV